MPEVAISPVAKAFTLVRAALAPPDSAPRTSLYSKAKREAKARDIVSYGRAAASGVATPG